MPSAVMVHPSGVFTDEFVEREPAAGLTWQVTGRTMLGELGQYSNLELSQRRVVWDARHAPKTSHCA